MYDTVREAERGKRKRKWRRRRRYGGTLPAGICYSVCKAVKAVCVVLFFTLLLQLLSSLSWGNKLGPLTTQYRAQRTHSQHNAFALTMLNPVATEYGKSSLSENNNNNNKKLVQLKGQFFTTVCG